MCKENKLNLTTDGIEPTHEWTSRMSYTNTDVVNNRSS